ncbi:MAG TPA: pyridoxamine 5'-phosphate oxidase family protein, partial [Gemmatimonadaceae bacterium]|nr:pyridoxamine 5'-phosphate oxidase family protein [Gemmatimonadaceae bacterium]
IGRLAFTIDGHVDVQPLHYVYEDGWIYGRTSFGSKITPIRHSHWVAFEVDEADGVFDWRSVVVHGGLYFLDPDGAPEEREEWVLALALLRHVVPGTGTDRDPVPGRTIVFRVHAADITGRASSAPVRKIPDGPSGIRPTS